MVALETLPNRGKNSWKGSLNFLESVSVLNRFLYDELSHCGDFLFVLKLLGDAGGKSPLPLSECAKTLCFVHFYLTDIFELFTSHSLSVTPSMTIS